MQPPVVMATGGQPQVYSNAWATFSFIMNGGTDHVTYTDLTYAYWAMAQFPVEPGTTMGQSGVMPVDTSRQDSVTFAGTAPWGGSAGFQSATPGGAETGSYRIIATADFSVANGYLLGLARPSNAPGIPLPVATFVAKPNDTFNITPVIKFYVAGGAYTPGQIIDFTVASERAAEIDFSGRAQTNVVVTQNHDGSFIVVYY
jgi:hypothetical protein